MPSAIPRSTGKHAALVKQWEARNPIALRGDFGAYCRFVQEALDLGDPLLAHDMCREALGLDGKAGNAPAVPHARLRQLHALALARCGATRAAQGVLNALLGDGDLGEDTLGILARTYKDMWLREADPARKQAALRTSIAHYTRAWQETHGYWTGINVATLWRLAGDEAQAVSAAATVIAQATSKLDVDRHRYWARASIGEACLVLGDLDRAAHWYVDACQQAEADPGAIASTRRQALLLLAAGHVAAPVGWIDKALEVPSIAVFAGGLDGKIDLADDSLGAEHLARVRAAMLDFMALNKIGVGYAGARTTADLLFLDVMQTLGRDTHVIVSAPHRDVVANAAACGASDAWLALLERVVPVATSVTEESDDATSGVADDYAKLLLLGLARDRVRHLSSTLSAFAVWDGHAEPAGGTASAIADWQHLGERVRLIDLRTGGATPAQTGDRPSPGGLIDTLHLVGEPQEFSQRIVSMIFADVVGSTRLRNAQTPDFVRHYMGAVGQLVARCKEPPLCRSAWGDGLGAWR